MRIFLIFLIGLISSHLDVLSISIYTQNPHPCVFSSLKRGLDELGATYNVNPSDADVHEVVLVLDGIDYLRHMITLKNNKRITHLLAGPNLMNRSCDFDRILSNAALDMFLVPSKWVEVAYLEDEPSLDGRITTWYAGVNINWWQPTVNAVKSQVLVYWKTDAEELCVHVEELLKSRGYTPTRLRYGTYSIDHYKNVLDSCEFAVFISRSESQGIALAEAWAMNLPTFVWNPGQLYYAGKQYNPVSSCPYLTDQQGKEWKTISELEVLLDEYQHGTCVFCPREWVSEHMTDKKSAELLLHIADSLKAKQ